MPHILVERLYQSLAAFLAGPDAALSEKFALLGATPVVTPPLEFARFIRANLVLWARVVRESGAKVD